MMDNKVALLLWFTNFLKKTRMRANKSTATHKEA